ncbi:unnamed protein product [Spirodela intermedia]|uniref:Uncharacterized protein n=2 Tax=Spirodela intermedia TaxID=51605 RepID=A0A7I8JQB1_SPIIN|nr:unnamed protein product [Spirodela intermedia]CAA6672326.1 unnamed protein product [Spirodela intermedia]CAA7409509.1 unnamed protein product [Spirodela intermedia]
MSSSSHSDSSSMRSPHALAGAGFQGERRPPPPSLPPQTRREAENGDDGRLVVSI